MRKVYVMVKTRLIIQANDDVNIENVLEDMDYNFVSNSDGIDILDSEIQDWDITDSK